MTSRPRASPASWPNPAPVPASPRSAPLFEPLCPPVARGSPTRPVMCCCSPPKLRVCLLPEPRVSGSRLPPHDSASCPVTGGDPPRWVPGKPHRKILCFPSPRSPRRCVLSPCGPTRPLNPRGAARFWPAAASGSQSCPAFPFSVHFGIWTLPVRPSLASVLCGFPWVCVLSCFCVYSERAPLPARLSAPFARSLAVKILTGCLWAPGTKDRVCGGGRRTDLPLAELLSRWEPGPTEGPGSLSPVKTEPCVTSTGFVSLARVDKPSLRFCATSLTPGPHRKHESGPRPDSLTAAVTPSPSSSGLLTRGLGSPVASTSALLSTGTHVHAHLLGRHPRLRLCRPFPCPPAAALSGASGLRRQCLFSFSAPARLRLGGQRACLAVFPIALLPREHKLTGTDLRSRGTAPHPPDGHLQALSLAVPRARPWRFSPPSCAPTPTPLRPRPCRVPPAPELCIPPMSTLPAGTNVGAPPLLPPLH